jgi:hypothetical protein
MPAALTTETAVQLVTRFENNFTPTMSTPSWAV